MDEKPRGKLAAFAAFLPPHRYMVIIIAWGFLLTIFIARLSQNVATNFMSVPKSSSTPEYMTTACGNSSVSGKLLQINEMQFNWTEDQKTWFKIFYHVGYLISSIFTGILTDTYDPKIYLNCVALEVGFLCFVTPQILRLGNAHIVMMVIEFALGIGYGMVYPAANSLLANWAPPRERGKLAGIIFSSNHFAFALNAYGTKRIIAATKKWSSVFYIYGGFMTVWFILFYTFVYSIPDYDPRLPSKEYRFLRKEMDEVIFYGKREIRWKRILTSLPVWACVVGNVALYWQFIVTVGKLPIYQYRVLGIDTVSSTRQYLAFIGSGCLVVFHGYCSDYLVNNEYLHITTARQIYTTFGAMGPAMFILAAAFSDCQVELVSIIIMCSTLGLSCTSLGVRINTLDVAPNYSGIIVTMVDSLQTVIYFGLNKITAAMTDKQTFGQWRNVFWLTLVIAMVANIFFVIFGSGETQEWNNLEVPDTENVKAPSVVEEDSDVEL